MRTLAVATVILATAAMAAATTIHVPDEQPTIQAGIDAAADGDTVLVACGIYYEHEIHLQTAICLRSESGQPGCVVMDAQYQYAIFYRQSVPGIVRIEGITFRRAYGTAIWCSDASLALSDCVFSLNSGRGLSFYGAAELEAERISFTSNLGTGLVVGGSATTVAVLSDILFLDNVADGDGGGLHCREGSSVSLENATFEANGAQNGGGLAATNANQVTLTNCSFRVNEASGKGGAVYLESCGDVELINGTVVHNMAAQGAGVYSVDSIPCFYENTIIAFSGVSEGVYAVGPPPALSCCDVYGNWGEDYGGSIPDQTGIAGNISEDPLFCDADAGNLTLHADSPCAPENNPGCGLIGALGVGCPPSTGIDGQAETTSWSAIKALYR